MRHGQYRWWLFVALGALLSWQDSAALAANWPRFRGPNGTGIAADSDIPVRWTEQEGVLWKSTIPGAGNSSPVVWGDKVFLQSSAADGKERLLLCLNAADGQVLWSRAISGSRARTHDKNTLASSTPATDGERVYALFWDGQDLLLVAYDFQGRQVWKRDLGPFTSQHGAGTSPIVWKDKVFVADDQDGSAVLLALNAATGKTVWEVPRRAFRTCYSTPFLLEEPGASPRLIVASTAGVTAYDPGTGAKIWDWTWHFSGMALRTVASAVAGQDMIFANSGDGSGERHTVALRVEGQGSDAKPRLVWEAKKTYPYVPTMLVWGDYLYFVNDAGLAGCRVARTGVEVWTHRLGGNMSASPVLIDGKIYAVSEAGEVSVFEAAPQFKLLAKNSLDEPVIASPAVADHRLLIRGKEHLFCIAKPGEKAAAK